jgi:hypothetical protein
MQNQRVHGVKTQLIYWMPHSKPWYWITMFVKYVHLQTLPIDKSIDEP